MRDALKTIASFRNPSAAQDAGQAAARLARETLDALGLFSEEPHDSAPTQSRPEDGGA